MKALAALGLATLMSVPAAALSWEWDCSVDPTTLDSNKDDVLDWLVRGGVNPGSFNMASIVDGKWTGGQILDALPMNDFAANTSVDIRWKSGGVGWSAVFWMNLDYTEVSDTLTTFSPVHFHLEDVGDTQTLRVYNVYANWVEREIATIEGLPDDFIDMHIDVDTAADTVQISIGGADRGTYGYTAWGPANNDRWPTVLGSAVQFDSVKILVKQPTVFGDANLDCKVNILDLIFIRNRIGQSPSTGDNWSADVNNDGNVNILDLIATRNSLNTGCP